MPRISLDVPDVTFRRLQELAQQERRDVRSQALYTLERSLGRRRVARPTPLQGPRPSTPAGKAA